MEQYEKLKEEILTRRIGVIHFDIRAIDFSKTELITQALDAYVEELGLHGIGDSWREVDTLGARKIIERILHRDLAYDSEQMHETDANNLANGVMSFFGRNAKFYTNGNFDDDYVTISPTVVRGPTWRPITGATFDTGIVFVDESRIGLIWVEDED